MNLDEKYINTLCKALEDIRHILEEAKAEMDTEPFYFKRIEDIIEEVL